MTPLALTLDDEDRYFDLTTLARYSGISLSTLRRHIADPVNPLPTHHVHTSGKDRGRTLVSKREFDAWVLKFPPFREGQPAPPKPRAKPSMQERIARALQK